MPPMHDDLRLRVHGEILVRSFLEGSETIISLLLPDGVTQMAADAEFRLDDFLRFARYIGSVADRLEASAP